MIQRTMWCLLISAVGLSNSAAIAGPNELTDDEKQQGFDLLFDGKTLDGWETKHPEKFRVENGTIVADGRRRRSMLYFVGNANGDPGFNDFELRMQVRVNRGANSGIYFRSAPREARTGFPDEWGYEAQIAISHKNPNKTGSLLQTIGPSQTVKVSNSPVREEEWFEYAVICKGRHIELKINGTTTARYTEPTDANRRRKTAGYLALQCHEPGMVRFRSIRIQQLK